MVAEVATVAREPVARVLARPALQRILQGSDAAPARANAFLEEMRMIRFPRLALARERLRQEIARLGLPAQVSVAVPRSLESDELRIVLRVRGASELEDSIAALTNGIAGLRRIIGLLGGDEF